MENKIYSACFIPILKEYSKEVITALKKGGITCIITECSENFLNFKDEFPEISLGVIVNENKGIEIKADFLCGENNIKIVKNGKCEEKHLLYSDIFDDNLRISLENENVLACVSKYNVLINAILNKEYENITEICKSIIKNILGIYVAHIGIKSKDKEESENTTNILAEMMISSIDRRPTSNFVDRLEILHYDGKGTHGHIAIGTTDYRRCKEYFKNQGFSFDEDTIKIRDEKPFFIYFTEEIAGFKYHLVENPK